MIPPYHAAQKNIMKEQYTLGEQGRNKEKS